ncbi:MAG: T9SS type A sorting domain-containing protein [Candidatus Marinimicrobia bacterium]|jgi:hypothetical protein|nr:T9SS type A sorting domain-containing protein [Candidatus Neomarinimicrobiota bacterium]MBT3618185.1 T9SS type A sorting domain-containing protein [Candidatus Neomarinimicrobiota bacterium]MBT3828656.1 T9SS type A sorting domain-containing protein [Candidatus Neomarinimicrobiota bacterium]MBT3996882.1 T9SS type A sorting domain-containing protein [Candidatus Neomarinimicrobiota bacterium]MBT4280846.1 T9SS type A sorting domain-containing protein [Candidatus Neomarinimicrobiota bacterium]
MKQILLKTFLPFFIVGLAGLSGQGHGGHGGGHGHGGNHLTTVDTVTTTGTAIVFSDTGHCFIHTRYFLDTDGNDTIDLSLRFGPESYEPESGAVRPFDGDEITVTGRVITRRGHSTMKVWTLNNMEWVNPDSGYGAHNGGGLENYIDSVSVTGTIIAETDSVHDRTRYFLDSDSDGLADYKLRLRYWLHTDSSATLPESGENVSIEGWALDCEVGTDKLWVVTMEDYNPANQQLGTDGYTFATEFKLSAINYPNPFNPTTTISYLVPEAGNVSVKIFDMLGHEIKTLAVGYHSSGTHHVSWNATNTSGKPVSGGMYFYVIQSGITTVKEKLIFLK